MNKPAIAVMTDLYWPSRGGVEESIRGLIEALADDFDFSVHTHQKSATGGTLLHRTVLLKSFDSYRDPAGIPVFPITPSPLGRLVMLPFILWNMPLLRRFIPKRLFDLLFFFYAAGFSRQVVRQIGKADLVHCCSTGHLAILCSTVCKKLGKPLIQAPPVHFNQWGDTPRLLKAYAAASVLICPTDTARQQLQKRGVDGPARIVINPPLPLHPPRKSRPPVRFIDPPFILFLGRRELHKGLGLLGEAFKRLPQASARLVIAGPGHAKSLPHTDCIELGLVDEPTKQWLLSKCDIFCVPSVSESFGMVFTEAMSYAKPVVALDVPPVNEIVVSGLTGILVRPGDPVVLSQALRRLLENPRERRKMGMAGYKRHQERYAREKIVANLRQWYKSLL